jgi:hypothetical protein
VSVTEHSVLFLELNESVRRIQVTAVASRPAAWIVYVAEKQIMISELAEEIFTLIEARSPGRPTTMEFELAYQARVASDRIRLAIKHTEGLDHTQSKCERLACNSWMHFSDSNPLIAVSRRDLGTHCQPRPGIRLALAKPSMETNRDR